jgi:hypothetical protein
MRLAVVVLSYRAVFVREIYWYLEKYFATIVVVVAAAAAVAVIVCLETFQFCFGFEEFML